MYGCKVSTFQSNLLSLSLVSYPEDGGKSLLHNTGNTETMWYIPKGHNFSCLFSLLTLVYQHKQIICWEFKSSSIWHCDYGRVVLKKSLWISYPWKMKVPWLFRSKHWESLASRLSVASISESQTRILSISSVKISNLLNGLMLLDFPSLFKVNYLSITGFCFLMLNIMMTLEQRMLMPRNQKICQALKII